jgi:hypothetical protein
MARKTVKPTPKVPQRRVVKRDEPEGTVAPDVVAYPEDTDPALIDPDPTRADAIPSPEDREKGPQDAQDGTDDPGKGDAQGTNAPDAQKAVQDDPAAPRTITVNGRTIALPRGYLMRTGDKVQREWFSDHPNNDSVLVLNEDIHRLGYVGGCKTPSLVLVAKAGSLYDRAGNRIGG